MTGTSRSLAAVDEEYAVLDIDRNSPVEGAVTFRINRPDARNALNGPVRAGLTEAIAAIEASEDIRVVVITGVEKAKAFAAGADVGELRERGLLEQRRQSEPPRIYERVSSCAKPVIARINGHALGGGLELALACDIRVAHESAKLGSPEINLGIIPGGGATQRLPRLIGEGQAMRLILTGDVIAAEEAYEIGLVDAVESGDTFDDTVAEIVSGIAAKSPVATSFAKEAIKSAAQLGLEDGIAFEAQLFAQLFATRDKDEGIDAFFEDREPEWEGR